MKTFSQKIALGFAIVNIIPAIFGIIMFWAIVPLPGLILYFFYWMAWENKFILIAERILWLATIIYNAFLIWLGIYETNFSFEIWGVVYQSVSITIALIALTSTFSSTSIASQHSKLKNLN